MIRRRARHLRPACRHGHPWTAKTTHVDRRGYRRCRTCHSLQVQRARKGLP